MLIVRSNGGARVVSMPLETAQEQRRTLHGAALLHYFIFLSCSTIAYVNKQRYQRIHSNMTLTTLVVGASGATGRHVVLQLLQRKQHVKAVVRSKERLLKSLDEIAPNASTEFA
eukprot:scaffold25419_cov108-Skeletonema_menzelii.AAC.1